MLNPTDRSTRRKNESNNETFLLQPFTQSLLIHSVLHFQYLYFLQLRLQLQLMLNCNTGIFESVSKGPTLYGIFQCNSIVSRNETEFYVNQLFFSLTEQLVNITF